MAGSTESEMKSSTEDVERNEEIANGNADSTKDGGHRPPAWNPPLVSLEDYGEENPYQR